MNIRLAYVLGEIEYQEYIKLLAAEQVDESRDDTREG